MGAVVALLVVMNVVGVGNMLVPLMVAILCAGALASARLYLGCHNGWQVLAGFKGGRLSDIGFGSALPALKNVF